MQDKTINNALLALRRQIDRDNLDGMDHVEALLSLRGVPIPRLSPARKPDVAGKGVMARMIIEALQAGHSTQSGVTAHVAARRPDLSEWDAYRRTSLCLARLKRSGRVVREGRAWRLANKGVIMA
ncbi:hypothetical protein P1J78_11060 [Psychromarinibacter sp. C21-152]|uniref:Uncharacterized protein n=1 Tax=Psychromarinibacter sediminicola TaxID=3033385 RepID=A0AAE3TA56_9RHOB|nr:hypothetical protein [Psychromarinibacter sediminicola]MDF0601270.1 hypothetical protein [Psychromarinibacter sediminicola]